MLLDACCKRAAPKLNSANVTLVFDRGIISADNATLIEAAQMKYISALDRNQIPSCGISLKPFESLSTSDESPKPEGFKTYDDDLYFYDHGTMDTKRLIVGFNPALFKDDRNLRKDKIKCFETFVRNENKGLKNAKRDRKAEAVNNRINNELRRLKIKKYFESPTLSPVTVQKRLKDGTVKSVNSYHIEIKKKSDTIRADKLLDGVCVFVTNHTEIQGRGYKVTPRSIIHAYREKTKIEDVFKNVKSFLKLRPFFVNTDNHVRAVYTICILAYFLNRFLANRRKTVEGKDYVNSKELYAPFRDIDYVTFFDKNSGRSIKKSVELPAATKQTIQKIGLSHLLKAG